MSLVGNVENIDDFATCKITRKEDWVDLYAKPYYFGCEADDRMNAAAFGKNNPFGSGLKAIFSSDIGHFDVIDMRHPLPEAYELVEDEHITPTTSAPSRFRIRSSCGAHRTGISSKAPASPNKPPPCSRLRKPDPRRRRTTPGTAAPSSGDAAKHLSKPGAHSPPCQVCEPLTARSVHSKVLAM
jgi:hypothetical protein